MTKRRLHPVALFLALGCVTLAAGATRRPVASDELARQAGAIIRGTVQSNQGLRDPATGRIQTRTVIQVTETLKGRVPALLEIVQPGGQLPRLGQAGCFSTRFAAGEEYLWFLQRGPGGKLRVVDGEPGAVRLKNTAPERVQELRRAATRTATRGEDVTDQAALAVTLDSGAPAAFSPPPSAGGGSLSNLIKDVIYGLGARSPEPDLGEPIPYQIDAMFLPPGISSNQARAAVEAALAAWEGGSTVRFEFRGWTNFGQAADLFFGRDGLLRIQLHNTYGVPFQGDVLGTGGFNYSTFVLNAGWGSGGNVNGYEFHQIFNTFVVLDHTNSLLQNTNLLAEVLCHEVGHALGLDHTSVNPGEPTNSSLFQSIMYFATHGDNRGAVINSVDRDSLCQSHSFSNTPPYVFSRYLDITTATNPPNIPGVNEIRFTSYDLQGGVITNNATDPSFTYGSFTLTNDRVRYTPATNGNGLRVDPNLFESYDTIYIRASDGTNASGYANVDVLSFNSDSTGPNGDGLPDNWAILYFGSADPNAVPRSGPNDDFDGDGYTNFEEYQMNYQVPGTGNRVGANPANGASNLRIRSISTDTITFESKAWDLYELEGSTNLTTWQRVASPVQPTSTNGVFRHKLGTNTPAWYFRVRRVP